MSASEKTITTTGPRTASAAPRPAARRAGIAAELDLGRAGLKAQMKYADRRGAPAAVILGGDEIAAGQVTVKDLDAGRALAAGIADNEAWKAERPGQVVAARADLVATVRRIADGPHTDA